MGLSFGIKDYIEGGVLVFVIVLNVTIGFWQEYRAEKRMDALRALSSPSAMVLRDGKTQVIPKCVAPDLKMHQQKQKPMLTDNQRRSRPRRHRPAQDG
jgi:hypothetical protein